jgi:hypothetical protein
MKYTEQNLMNLAAQMICELGINTTYVRDLAQWSPIPETMLQAIRWEFAKNVKEKVFSRIKGLDPAKLAYISILALPYKSKTALRSSTVYDVIPTRGNPANGQGIFAGSVRLVWGGSNPRELLAEIACPVVLAAMFDIIATSMFLQQQGGPCLYKPSPRIRRFVEAFTLPKGNIASEI